MDKLGSPLSCMSFHDDGLTCAVGTESGRVLVYDLRQPEQPIATHEGKGRVNALQFAPSITTSSVARTKEPARRTTLSPETPSEQKDSSVEELGQFVDSVLHGDNRDSASAFATRRSTNDEVLDRVCGVNVRCLFKHFQIMLLTHSFFHTIIVGSTRNDPGSSRLRP